MEGEHRAFVLTILIIGVTIAVGAALGKGCQISDNETKAKIIQACLQAGRSGDECRRAAQP
jgi:hypothetical protein